MGTVTQPGGHPTAKRPWPSLRPIMLTSPVAAMVVTRRV
jgi:hypothetical protein